jgi:hypothetical protein
MANRLALTHRSETGISLASRTIGSGETGSSGRVAGRAKRLKAQGFRSDCRKQDILEGEVILRGTTPLRREAIRETTSYRLLRILREQIVIIAVATIPLAVAVPPCVLAAHAGSSRTIQPALLPVPYTANESNDPSRFKPAPPDVILHECLLLPGWVNKPEFEDLKRWLIAQGFTIKQALEPEPWRTYPELKFSGTVGQFENAFHITVMQTTRGTHGP